MTARDSYHHGDLRSSLLSATVELVRERGARGFSVSEAARRAGVSISAPYRHFVDRDDMLAAAVQRGFAELDDRFVTLVLDATLPGRAAQLAVAHVAFACEDPARFEVMFASGIDKSAHPELLDLTRRTQQRLEDALAPHVTEGDRARRAAELWAIAHGVAALAVDHHLQHVVGRAHVESVADSAARTWAAGVRGAAHGTAGAARDVLVDSPEHTHRRSRRAENPRPDRSDQG